MGVCNIIKEQIEKNNEIKKDKKIKKGLTSIKKYDKVVLEFVIFRNQ